MSLRNKIILAMLLSSLASVALVGLVANQRLMRKFDDLAAESASRSFRADVAAYIGQWGSWDEAQRHESFRAFAERRRDAMRRPALIGPDSPPPPPDGIHAERPERPMRDAAPAGNRPPPPGGPGLARSAGATRPPFRFLLISPEGKALMGVAPYKIGDPVSAEDRARALPVEVDGKVVAHAMPEGQINYSDLDLGYLGAMREALLYGVGAAALLAVGLGLLLGTHLSSNLRRLTQAIKRMQAGELGLQAEVRGSDEVGELAQAFNGMSSELARNHETLHELSVRDALTSLHNRRHFDEQLGALYASSARREHPLSIMIGDIDHFKQINDQFSHAMGDRVLQQVSEILRKSTRGTDLVARYGGEEFVIAFTDTPLEQAHLLCDKLREAIAAHPWQDLHPELKVTISIGVASLSRDDSLDEVMRVADELLYRAKSAGRNQVCAAT
ncbi:MAG: GGDEF domain-containing protein [Rhodocyclaceae bacterium]